MTRFFAIWASLALCLVLGACCDHTAAKKSDATVTLNAAPVPATQPGDDIKVAPPVIPDQTFNLTQYGGKGDGSTFNTAAFTRASAAIQRAGGGHLIVPAGTYVTLPFTLVSHMDLHLDAGAVIQAPDNFKDYGLPDPAHTNQDDVDDATRGMPSLIEGTNLSDVAITGSGTIDGEGAIWWIWSDKAARRYPKGRLVYFRPRLVTFRNCKRLHVDGVTLQNSPMFHLVTSKCEDVLFENIRIYAPSDAPNTDAMDPGAHRLIIRNCEVDTGDDAVAIQGGSWTTQDVLIEDLTILHSHGISIGSPTQFGVRHMFVRRCTFDGSDNGIRIKSYRGRGGIVQDIHYTDITMKNVNRAIDINMLYNGNANTKSDVGDRAAKGHTQNVPQVHDIEISNLKVTRTTHAGRILGTPEFPANNFTLNNVSIQAVDGLTLQDATNVILNHVDLDIHVGQPLTTDNAQFIRNP